MRKSSREARKPELYDPTFGKKNRLGRLDEDGSEDEQGHSSAEEEEDELDFDLLAKKKKAPKRADKPAGKQPSTKATSSKKLTESYEEVVGNNLFEKILHGNRYDAEVTEWVEYYKVDRVASINELVNLTLMAAGAKDDCIALDIDLDALDHEEIDQLLSEPIKKMTQEIGSKLYPLIQKGKGKIGNFRNKYKVFWETLTHKIHSLKSEKTFGNGKGVSKVEDLLRRVVEQLTMLSSMAVVNIRDAVCEAVLSIADALCEICNQVKQQVQIADRQLNAETSKKGKDVNPKVKAFTQQRDESRKELEMLASVLNSIFQSIYIHRSKDFNDEIRLNCLEHLPSFVSFDTTKPIKTEYLKYLGWACNDYSNHVRATAIRVMHKLIENDDYIAHLQNFVDHFMDRFIEIAAGDVDAEVSYAMISALRTMQRQGFLDTVSEDKLDMVDVLVFDPSASPKARKEALLFLMDHTEGFEDFDEKSVLSKANITKANAGKSKKSNADLLALEKKKNIALQLETLTEFAEHHLRDNIEWCNLLAEACIETHKAELLFDWSTIISLLMRESEELITTALQPKQVSILLRLFVTSASYVNKQAEKTSEGQDASAVLQKSTKATSSTQLYRDLKESLNTSLQMKLPQLLQRFKDEESNLAILSELFSFCDIVSSSKSLKTLLNTLTDLFLSYKHEKLIKNALGTFKEWLQDSTAAPITRTALEGLFKELNSQLLAASKELQKLQTQSNKQQKSASSSSSSKRKSSSSSSNADTMQQIDAILVDLSPVLLKLKSMFEVMDCRYLLHINEDDFADHILEVAELAPTLSTTSSSSSGLAGSSSHAVSVLTNGLNLIKALILWRYRDLLDYFATSKRNAAYNEDDARAAELVEGILSLRDKLVDSATSFLAMADEPDREDAHDSIVRQMRLQGFRMISWIRMTFPLKENDYHIADSLAYSPSQEVLNYLRQIFESEGKRIQLQMLALQENAAGGAGGEEETTGDHEQLSALVNELVTKLLFPLSRSLMIDLQHLNRRQTAAVLMYWLDPHDKVQEAVRHVAKRLKEGDVVKYLEVQLVVLKSVFQEHVLAITRERKEAMEQDDEDFDYQQSEALEKEGYEKLVTIARKMSSLMGIAKLKEDTLAGLMNFYRAGLEFAFANLDHIGFVEALDVYVRFLPGNELKEVSEQLLDYVESNEDFLEEYQQQERSGNFSPEIQRVVDLKNHLEGKERNVRRLSTSSTVSNKLQESRKSEGNSRVLSKQASRSMLSIDQGTKKAPATKGRVGRPPKADKEPKAKPKAASKQNRSLESIPGRRSSRTAAGKPVSYREDDISDIEEFDEEEFAPKSKKRRGSDESNQSKGRGRPKRPSSFSMGLDIEDEDMLLEDDDEEEDVDSGEVRDRLSALASDSFSKYRGSSSSTNKFQPNKRQRSDSFEPELSPIGTSLREMDSIPSSRRSRGR